MKDSSLDKILHSCRDGIMCYKCELELKQAIKELITKREREARIDELENLIESTKCLRADCRTNHKVKRSSIDDRIEELTSEGGE